jgi:hypothetical protein
MTSWRSAWTLVEPGITHAPGRTARASSTLNGRVRQLARLYGAVPGGA